MILAAALAAVPAHATTFIAMSERALARAADAIVVGTVTDLAVVGGSDGAISTLVTIHVDTRYKGDGGGEIVLRQPGGELADRGLVIPGSPVFTRGEQSLFFLSAGRDGAAQTTALGLGKYRLAPDAAGRLTAERAVSEPVLGGGHVRRVKLARLVRTIRKAVATDPAPAPRPLVAMPAEAVDPTLERIAPEAFTLMENPSGRWHEADLGQTVVYGVDPAGDSALGPDATFAALDAAFAAWTNVPGATINLARGTAASIAPLICDGQSQIVFGDPFNEMPKPQSCSGVLALGGYCTKGRGTSESDVVNGVKFRRIAEGNITFNGGFGGCYFWNPTNLAEVATHEIGHTIGIGHSSESDDEQQPPLKDATMYYRAHFDGRGASIRSDDVAAVRFVYPGDDGTVTDDADGDGIPDAGDDCPGDDPALGMANPSQTDTDGDGMGDLCDACPLAPMIDGVQTCEPISSTWLRVSDATTIGDLLWRGEIVLPDGADLSQARVVLTAGSGVLVDVTPTAAAIRRKPHRRRILFKSEFATVALKRSRLGTYTVRVSVRDVPLADQMPVVSASLEVGTTSFATTLSCPPRGGRRFTCRG
jgi:Matrixin